MVRFSGSWTDDDIATSHDKKVSQDDVKPSNDAHLSPISDRDSEAVLDVTGIGIGPANLSLAALLDLYPEIRSRFYDGRARFSWHSDLLLPAAELQVSFIKDLVSLVAPNSRLSFLCFLHEQGRLHAFLNARFDAVLRLEFNQYLQWACRSLQTLSFGNAVIAVDHLRYNNFFSVESDRERIKSRSIVLGTGLVPRVPNVAIPHLGEKVFHGSEFLAHKQQLAGKRIAIVGGGQTGAEVFLNVISREGMSSPEKVYWISRRPNFLPMDDSPFTNELYTPAYSDHFFSLARDARLQLLETQKLTSDGISSATLTRIYQRLYQLRFLMDDSTVSWSLRPCRELVSMSKSTGGWQLGCVETTTASDEQIDADFVIFCTGYEYRMPDCLSPLRRRISWGADGYSIRRDFSIEWDGPDHLRIYVLNAARTARGVADPNLSLLSWRAAKIANSIAGREIYRTQAWPSLIDWNPQMVAESAGSRADTKLESMWSESAAE